MDLDIYTRELLKTLLLPPGGLLILLLIGWLFARRLFGRLLILIAGLGLYLLSTQAVVSWLASQVETIPAPSAQQIQSSAADAILVLMADRRRADPTRDGADGLSRMSLERLDHACTLHRLTGLPLLVSGGSPRGEAVPLAEIGAAWLRERCGVEQVMVERESRDTRENLRDSAALLHAKGLGRVLLVTHAYHMPRAMFSAHAAGLDAVPAPFGFERDSGGSADAGPDYTDWLPRPGYLGISYLMLHERVGLLWYRFTRP